MQQSWTGPPRVRVASNGRYRGRTAKVSTSGQSQLPFLEPWNLVEPVFRLTTHRRPYLGQVATIDHRQAGAFAAPPACRTSEPPSPAHDRRGAGIATDQVGG